MTEEIIRTLMEALKFTPSLFDKQSKEALWKYRHCGSMEKSHDFATLPTMTWIPLCGIHIPTKPATDLSNMTIKALKPGVHFSSLDDMPPFFLDKQKPFC